MKPDRGNRLPFDKFGFTIDIARMIERPEVILDTVRSMNDHGYNVCMLYLEDAVVFPRHPKIARPHAYTLEFMRELQELCAGQNIELIPCVNSLGHAEYITLKEGYEKYDEGRGSDRNCGVLCAEFPETYDLLKDLYEDWCLNVPGEYIHAGCDEAYYLGDYIVRTQGKDAFDPPRMFADHCNKLHGIAKSLGRRMMVWGDMFYYYPRAMELMDKDIVVVDWYYYTFPKTPRVEAFNFADVDSAGRLRRAGFEVWCAPSIWPNDPFPDVADRWQLLTDWIRYGKQAGIQGCVNCDWENRAGFAGNSDLIFRAFGDNVLRPEPLPIEEAIRVTLSELTGVEIPAQLASDICSLGRYHLTGWHRRAMRSRPLLSLANTFDQAECRDKCDSLGGMFRDLPGVLAATSTPQGKDCLTALKLTWEQLKVIWRLGAMIPDCYTRLCETLSGGEDHRRRVADDLLDMASASDEFAKSYSGHWQKLRYSDTDTLTPWIANVSATLREWAHSLDKFPVEEHPLLATPRLELELRSRYPALPVLETTVEWPKGKKQELADIMLRFESGFAVPEAEWAHVSCHPLSGEELPSEVVCKSTNYGQVGISDVRVVRLGKTHHYKMVECQGEHIQREDGVLWLGPIGATVDSPVCRTEYELAGYRLTND